MRRPLLVVACSATKVEGGPLSAYELYDGPAYRVLRAAGFPFSGPAIRVRILSAEHGLISAWDLTDPYDRIMDTARAAELGALPEPELRRCLFLPYESRTRSFEHFPASEVFAWGGRLYWGVVRAWEARGIFAHVPGGVTYSSGGIGTQLGQLKRWLQSHRHDSGCTGIRGRSIPVAGLELRAPVLSRGGAGKTTRLAPQGGSADEPQRI
jgi:hypothetical protein